jgi:carboxymethylenebutenolidase
MSQLERSMVAIKGPAHQVNAYVSRPAGTGRHPGLIVIHEIWGLVQHTKDVSDRFAAEGFAVLAPDLMGSDPALAPTFAPQHVEAVMQFFATLPPGKSRDPTFVQRELAKLPEDKRVPVGMFFATAFGGKLPYARFATELAAAHEYLKAQDYITPTKVGSLGFCFGGGMSFRLACAGATQACVVFYGQSPDPIDQVENINCPVLGNYGAEDTGLNATLDQLVAAMVRYKKDFEMKIYPGAPHAFFNDTNPHTYREAAANEAWGLTLEFLRRNLQQG